MQAFRRLARSKGFTVTATVTLALGIGATTAVFAVVHAVLLQPLPFAEPDRLMAVRALDRRSAQPRQLSYPDFFDLRAGNRTFEHLVAYRDAPFTLTDAQPPVQVTGVITSWDLFELLGIEPALGRGFRPDDERPGTHVVVLSHALWTTRFGADAGIVGQAVPVNGVPFTIVGVAPEGFRFPLDVPPVGLWVTLSDDALGAPRGARMLDMAGRLGPGVSAEQARMQMDIAASALARQYPDSNRHLTGAWITPEARRVAGPGGKALLVLLGAVTLVLLIACANVASLLLARSTERAREFTLRIALGASRAALVRQLLIESLALGLLGAAGGVLVALGILQAVLPLAGDTVPRLAQARLDVTVLAFAAGLALLTSVVFGLVPALQAAAMASPAAGLKEGARGIAPGRTRFQGTLVVGQVALGLVLLVGAEMLMATVLHLTRRDPGFRADHLLTFELGVSDARYPAAKQIAFCDRLLERLAALPGVQAAAAGTPLPLQGHQMRIAFDIEERPAEPADRPRADVAIVTPGYFATLGIPLLKGRDFSGRDQDGAAPVVVVNHAFARRYFPGDDALGKRIRPGAGPPPAPLREIVGVVGDAKQDALGTAADPIYYFPYKQLPWRIGSIVLRTAVPPTEVESAARAALVTLDAEVPMHHVRTGERLAEAVMAPARFLTVLLTGFAAVALTLTVAGLYGLLTYMVAKRQREIGVRTALGAGRADAIRMVLRRAGVLVAAGLVLGLLGAFGLGRLLVSAGIGGAAGLPAVVALACGVIALAGAAAATVPAARAAAIDPIRALRAD